MLVDRSVDFLLVTGHLTFFGRREGAIRSLDVDLLQCESRPGGLGEDLGECLIELSHAGITAQQLFAALELALGLCRQHVGIGGTVVRTADQPRVDSPFGAYCALRIRR